MRVNPTIPRAFPCLAKLCRGHRLGTGTLMIIAGGWTQAALAQNADDPAASSASNARGELQEVVVSARRHEERLESVPVSVSALSAQALAEQKVQSELDLQSTTPGLTVTQTSSNQLNFSLRGQARDQDSGSSPAVLTYFDEFQSSAINSTALFDLQSVQVLKGPQGTLFGRNATGGAILYEAVRPGRQLDGYLRASGGNYSDREAEGAINVPFGDVAALRIAAEYQKRDGFQHNLLLGIDPASVDDRNFRASLLLSPTEQLENLTILQYGQYGGYSVAARIANAYPIGSINMSRLCIDSASLGVCHLNTTAATLYGPPGYLVFGQFPSPQVPGYKGILDFINKQNSQDFYDVTDTRTNAHDAHQRMAINKTTYTFSKAAVLKNITGYNKALSRDQTDDVGAPYEVLQIAGPNGEGHTYVSKQYSEELQLMGLAANDRLNYIFGGYYGRDDFEENLPTVVGADFVPIIGAPIAPFTRAHFRLQDISKAGYFQGSYELIPGMHATAGFRETWESVTIVHLADDTYTPPDVGNATQRLHKPSWTVGLDYQVTPGTLLYVTQRGSYRAGGFNGTSNVPNPANPSGPNLNNEFQPETTWDVEIGSKFAGTLGGMPTRLTLAAYDQMTKDIQRVAFYGIAAQTRNVNKARTTGVEFESQLELARWLQVGVNYAYTNARYTDGHSSVVDSAGIHPVIFGPFGFTPTQTGSAYVRLVEKLSAGRGELVARGDVYAQSGFYYSNLADTYTPDTRIGGYALMNLRLEWNDICGSKVSVSAWGRNLADRQYLVGGFALGAAVGLNSTLPGVPRTYGADVSVKF